jgi:alkylation response protein AidB-like acyl-CoA dehydrogenase
VNFQFTEEQRLVRAEVRSLLEREWSAADLRAAWTADEPALEIRRRLADLGVRGITVPERFGGLGGDDLALVLVLEEYGRAAIPDAVAIETSVAAPLLGALGGEAAERWLPIVAKGEASISVGLGDGYVADADIADLIVLLKGDDRVVLIEKGAAEAVRQPSFDGARRMYSIATHRGDRVDAGPEVLAVARDRALFTSAAQLLGLAERMLDMAVAHAKVREQFGQPIGSFQAIKHRLAECKTSIELARPVVYAAAWAIASSQPDRSVYVALARLFANRAANLAARHALQVHGGIGFAAEHDLHMFLKRAKALELSSGGSASPLRRIADHLQV